MKILSRHICLNFDFQHNLFKDVILFLVILRLGFFARDIYMYSVRNTRFIKKLVIPFWLWAIQIKFQTTHC